MMRVIILIVILMEMTVDMHVLTKSIAKTVFAYMNMVGKVLIHLLVMVFARME